MNEMERFLLNLPYLKDVKLVLIGNDDLADGYRWQMLTSGYKSFSFEFGVKPNSIDEILRSFRTPFWTEEKHCIVKYSDKCLYSVHDSSNKPIERSMCICDVEKFLEYISLESELPHICEFEIMGIPIAMLGNIKDYQFQRIHKLDFWIKLGDTNYKNVIKTLSRLFPHLKHLVIKCSSSDFSIEDMIYAIDKFQYLQNLSWLEKPSAFEETIIYDHRQLICQMTQRLTDDNFTCRVFYSNERNLSNGVHWWIGVKVIHFNTISI